MCGLSPLARGTPATVIFYMFNLRFIPAGAGNTMQYTPPQSFCTVYPRWRGEHLPAIYLPVAAFGLSPLARGTLNCAIGNRVKIRFIPAGAGNTFTDSQQSAHRPVYPRWRGEHPMTLFYSFPFTGLSPLARGTLPRIITKQTRQRFIPAGAGNTSATVSIRVSLSVYPRWRGEHANMGRVI